MIEQEKSDVHEVRLTDSKGDDLPGRHLVFGDLGSAMNFALVEKQTKHCRVVRVVTVATIETIERFVREGDDAQGTTMDDNLFSAA